MNVYAIIAHGTEYAVTRNGHAIILSATRKPMTFATIAAAQAFIAVNVAADDRHAMPYRK